VSIWGEGQIEESLVLGKELDWITLKDFSLTLIVCKSSLNTGGK
jgi:hypothetical protein